VADLAVVERLHAAAQRAGGARDHLLEIRVEEGLLGDAQIRARLDAWWTDRAQRAE
jgi:hypothetical protein